MSTTEPTMDQWGRHMRELRDTGHLSEFGRGFLAGVEAHERSAGAAVVHMAGCPVAIGNTGHCTCTPVEVVSERSAGAEPRTEAGRRFHAAKHPRKFHSKQFDRSCGLIQDILAIEAGATERSAGTTPLDVDDLGWTLYEMGIDDLPLDDARKLAAHIIVRLAARVSEGTDR